MLTDEAKDGAVADRGVSRGRPAETSAVAEIASVNAIP